MTASTNLDARAGAPGDVFTADEQTAGRGRLDHRWLSAPGVNLMMSVVLPVGGIPLERAATLPLVVGLAVQSAVAKLLPGSSVAIKWPNDVYVVDRKIAGILCERVGDNVVAGMGVNVNQTVFVPEIAARATSLACEVPVGTSFEVPRVRNLVLDELDRVFARWRTDGFAALHARYAAVDWLKGRRVAVMQTDSDKTPVSGLCGGVQVDGTLRVGDVSIYAGEAHVVSES